MRPSEELVETSPAYGLVYQIHARPCEYCIDALPGHCTDLLVTETIPLLLFFARNRLLPG